MRSQVLDSGPGTELGMYEFKSEPEVEKIFSLRSRSGHWLAFGQVSENGVGHLVPEFHFVQDWRLACVLTLRRPTMNATHQSAPFIPEGESRTIESPAPYVMVRTNWSVPVDTPIKIGVLSKGLSSSMGDKAIASKPWLHDWAKDPPQIEMVEQPQASSIARDLSEFDLNVNFDDGKWSKLADKLAAGDPNAFPEQPVSGDWLDLNTIDASALGDVLNILESHGANRRELEQLNIASLKRHHISRTELDLPQRDAEREQVLGLLRHHLDVRDDLDTYLQRVKNFMQARFSVQDNVIEQIASQLNIVDISKEKAPKVTANEGVSFMLALGGIAKHFLAGNNNVLAKQVVSLVSTLGLAVSLYRGLKGLESDSSEPEDRSTTALASAKVDLLEDINESFINIGYALDHVRSRIERDPSALTAWRDANPIFPLSTDVLDDEINQYYRSFVWTRLLPAACVIKFEQYEEKQFETADYADGKAKQKLGVDLFDKRREDSSILAGECYYYHHGHWGTATVFGFYRLQSRTGNLDADTIRELVVNEGLTPRTLFNSCGIEVIPGELDHSYHSGESFSLGERIVAKLTPEESIELNEQIAKRLH